MEEESKTKFRMNVEFSFSFKEARFCASILLKKSQIGAIIIEYNYHHL